VARASVRLQASLLSAGLEVCGANTTRWISQHPRLLDATRAWCGRYCLSLLTLLFCVYTLSSNRHITVLLTKAPCRAQRVTQCCSLSPCRPSAEKTVPWIFDVDTECRRALWTCGSSDQEHRVSPWQPVYGAVCALVV
jgi:hypothetical protein